MFLRAAAFSQDVENWDVSSGTDFVRTENAALDSNSKQCNSLVT
jgi:hypothetical protein